ncbi:MAG: phage GP46 family protein [Pseudomonadota bacterium]
MDAQLFFSCGPDVCADVGVLCGDLATGNELSTAVMLSLFTDRRANDDDTLPDGTDPRGWWADAMDGQRIGSRLWLLESARSLPETFRLAGEYAEEALQWLVDDGIAKSVQATAVAVGGCDKVMWLTVLVCKPDGKTLRWKYRYAWDMRKVLQCEVIH